LWHAFPPLSNKHSSLEKNSKLQAKKFYNIGPACFICAFYLCLLFIVFFMAATNQTNKAAGPCHYQSIFILNVCDNSLYFHCINAIVTELHILPMIWQFSLLNFHTYKHILGVGGGYVALLRTCIHWERWWDTGVSRSRSVKPSSRIHIENPIGRKASWKNC
jgi:hypothetical protein